MSDEEKASLLPDRSPPSYLKWIRHNPQIVWLAFASWLTIATIFGHAQLKEILRDLEYFSDVCKDEIPCDEQDQLLNDMLLIASMCVNLAGIFHGTMLKLFGRRIWTIVTGFLFGLAFSSFSYSTDYSWLTFSFVVMAIAGSGQFFTYVGFCDDFEPQWQKDAINLLLFTIHDFCAFIFLLFKVYFDERDAGKGEMQTVFACFSVFVALHSILFALYGTPPFQHKRSPQIRRTGHPPLLGDHTSTSDSNSSVNSLPEKDENGTLATLKHDLQDIFALLQKAAQSYPMYRILMPMTAVNVLQMYFYMGPLREQMEMATDNNEDQIDELLTFWGYALPIWGALSTWWLNRLALSRLKPAGWFKLLIACNFCWMLFTNLGSYFPYWFQAIPMMIFIYWRMFFFQALLKLCQITYTETEAGLLFSLIITCGGLGQAPAVGLDKWVVEYLNYEDRLWFNVALWILATLSMLVLVRYLECSKDSPSRHGSPLHHVTAPDPSS